MKIYTKKEDFYKRYNLKGREVAVKAEGYLMDYYTDAEGSVFRACLEKRFGWWYATDWATGLSISNFGCKTRKAMAEYVDSIGEKLAGKVLEVLKHHENVYDLPAMTYDEYSAALHADEAEEAPDPESEPAAEPEAEPETAEPAEPEEVVETAEPAEQNEQKEVEPAEQNDSEPADVSYYRFIGDFATCQTLEALKNTYLIEYGKHKDERNVITELTRAWGKHFDNVKCLHVNKSGKIYSTENRDKHEEVSDFPMLVELVSGLGDISISIEGTWTWITGNTKPHKEALKSLGFRWSPKRRAWCKLPAEKCA